MEYTAKLPTEVGLYRHRWDFRGQMREQVLFIGYTNARAPACKCGDMPGRCPGVRNCPLNKWRMKMMSKHTPGPWSYRKVPRKQEWEINTKRCPNSGHESWTGMSVVFGCDDYPKMGKIVGEANARLIAAAPELLDALEGMLEIYGVREQHMSREPFASSTEVDCCNQARAAIAKAKGEQK